MFPNDASTWSEDRTIAAIVARRPTGWTFAFGRKGLAHHVIFRDAEKQIVWEFESPAANLALFEAYAYLATRTSIPVESGINWSSRPPPRLSPVHLAPSTDLPEDLDPDALDAVYREAPLGPARKR
jgi:hypothetical protein